MTKNRSSYLQWVFLGGAWVGASICSAQTLESNGMSAPSQSTTVEQQVQTSGPALEALANDAEIVSVIVPDNKASPVTPIVRIVSENTPSATISKVRTSIGTVTALVGDADIGELARLRRRAQDAAVNAMATDGFFDPKISVSVERGNPDRWVFSIDAGPRSTITRLHIAFQGAITTPEFAPRLLTLEQGWSLNLGSYFSNDEWESAKNSLLTNLLDQDFPAARWVETRADVNVEKSSVSLRVEVDSGPQVLISGLEVTGLRRLNEDVISRYVRYEPGMPFRRDLLLEWQKQLQTAPFFRGAQLELDLSSVKAGRKDVRPTPRKRDTYDPLISASPIQGGVTELEIDRSMPAVANIGEQPNQVAVPLVVRVTEARARRGSILLGADSDVGLRTELVYRHNVPWGKAISVETGTHLDKDRQLVYADIFTAPTEKGYQNRFGVLAHDTDIQDVRTRQFALAVIQERNRRGLEDVSRVEYDTRLAARLAHDETRIHGRSDSVSVNTFTASWDLTRRDVNDRNDPREGNLVALGIGGGTDLDGSNQFYRLTLRGQQWWTINPTDIVTVRGELGRVFARQDYRVPQDFLFRTGGARTVRGYPFLGIGKRVGDAVLGDRAMVVASAEYTHYFSSLLGVAGFIDTGDVAETVGEFDLKTGVGMGVRVRTPAGPVNLDVAYGVDDRRLRLSFALGLAF